MIREDRYMVFKRSDIEKYLTGLQQAQLSLLASHINAGRRRDCKPPIETVVVESDWPEYEPVWAMIAARVDKESHHE